MRRSLFVIGLVAVLALPALAGDDGPSIVSLSPRAAEALKAQGRSMPMPLPAFINSHRKMEPGAYPIGPLPIAATQKVLVLFVQFTDNPPGGPASRLDLGYYDDMLFGDTYDPPEYAAYAGHPTDRTLKNYYKQVSYNYIQITTDNLPSTQGWLQTGKPYAYYFPPGTNGFGASPNNARTLVRDAVLLADAAGVDFSQYAHDGVLPNLFVVVAGTGAEWSGTPDLMWSHSWSIGGGGLTVDGVQVNAYAMMPEVGGDLTGYAGVVTGPYPPTVGVFAHEYGHVLGLPDEYDYGYDSWGTGIVSLMCFGSWNGHPNFQIFDGNSPALLDAWAKYRLGFVSVQEITSPQNITLLPSKDSNVVYRMDVPGSGGVEYFLFENRQQTGFDEGFQYWGVVGGVSYYHGLAIYHIDNAVLSRNYWRPNEAQNWREFRSLGWQPAWTGEKHYGISLIQADGWYQMEQGLWGGFSSDLFPGRLGVTSLGNFTSPNSTSYYFWKGVDPKFGYSGVTVKNIAEAGGNITADFSFEPYTK